MIDMAVCGRIDVLDVSKVLAMAALKPGISNLVLIYCLVQYILNDVWCGR